MLKNFGPYLKLSPIRFINGDLVCDAPSDEWDPKVGDEERNKKYRVNIIVEFFYRTQYHNTFITHDQHNYCCDRVETYSVSRSSGLPTKCDCT